VPPPSDRISYKRCSASFRRGKFSEACIQPGESLCDKGLESRKEGRSVDAPTLLQEPTAVPTSVAS
jgi:hypothetical protein